MKTYLRTENSFPSIRVLVLIVAVLLSLLQSACKADNTELSSRNGYIGGGIFANARTCPKIELRWMRSFYDSAPTAYIRAAGEDLVIGQGMGTLSPNCKHFWFVPSERTPGSAPIFLLFDAEMLSVREPVKGVFPTWLDNSSQLVLVRGDFPEVHIYSVETGKSRSLFRPKDSQPCAQFSDGPDWQPPKVISSTQIEFTYATKVDRDPAVDPNEAALKPAKTVLIDSTTGAIVKTTQSKLACDYYPAEGEPHKAKKAPRVPVKQ